jgi:hypothetical protein
MNPKYINNDEIIKDIYKEYEEIISLKEIFIINKKNKIIYVTNNVNDMLNFICNYKPVKQYNLLSYLSFLHNMNKNSCKWQTYDKKRVIKYYNTIKLTKINSNNRNYLEQIKEDVLIKNYFREQKLIRIINE